MNYDTLKIRFTLSRPDSVVLQMAMLDAITHAVEQRKGCLRDTPAYLEWSARIDRLNRVYQTLLDGHYRALSGRVHPETARRAASLPSVLNTDSE